MKALIIFVGLCLLAPPADAQSAISVPHQSADAERYALARQYLELAKPDWLNGRFEVNHTVTAFMLPRMLEEVNLFSKGAAPSSSPISRIVYGQLQASFRYGADRIAPKLVDALVMVYARLLTVDELQVMITYEEEPAQRAAETVEAGASVHVQALFDAWGAKWDRELKTGVMEQPRFPPFGHIEKSLPNEAPPTPPPALTPPASPTWDAIVAKQRAIYLASYSQLNRLWPKVASVARADYCARVHCHATDRQILTSLGKVFADPNDRV
jgi:hypothetical protein